MRDRFDGECLPAKDAMSTEDYSDESINRTSKNEWFLPSKAPRHAGCSGPWTPSNPRTVLFQNIRNRQTKRRWHCNGMQMPSSWRSITGCLFITRTTDAKSDNHENTKSHYLRKPIMEKAKPWPCIRSNNFFPTSN